MPVKEQNSFTDFEEPRVIADAIKYVINLLFDQYRKDS